MFEPVTATMERETPKGEPIKLNVTSGSGKINTRLVTYVGATVLGGYKEVPGAKRDVTEWPHDIVPKRPDGKPEIVYPIVWNEAEDGDGNYFTMHSGWRWDDSKGRLVNQDGAWMARGNYSRVL